MHFEVEHELKESRTTNTQWWRLETVTSAFTSGSGARGRQAQPHGDAELLPPNWSLLAPDAPPPNAAHESFEAAAGAAFGDAGRGGGAYLPPDAPPSGSNKPT